MSLAAGIFVALALRFDQSRAENKKHFPKPYFTACFTAYCLGLFTTIAVMQIFKAAQVFHLLLFFFFFEKKQPTRRQKPSAACTLIPEPCLHPLSGHHGLGSWRAQGAVRLLAQHCGLEGRDQKRQLDLSSFSFPYLPKEEEQRKGTRRRNKDGGTQWQCQRRRSWSWSWR